MGTIRVETIREEGYQRRYTEAVLRQYQRKAKREGRSFDSVLQEGLEQMREEEREVTEG